MNSLDQDEEDKAHLSAYLVKPTFYALHGKSLSVLRHLERLLKTALTNTQDRIKLLEKREKDQAGRRVFKPKP